MYVTREVKRFLRGRIYVEDGYCAVEQDTRLAVFNWQGNVNGGLKSIYAGVSRKERTYSVSDSAEAYHQFLSCLGRVGRIAVFQEVPDTLGAFRKNGMGNIVLYAMEKDLYQENTLTITVFTARGLFSIPRLNRSLKLLEQQLFVVDGIEAETRATVKEYKKQRREEARQEETDAKNASLSQNRKIQK